ncbi:5-oxoprolinase subunit PxpB [Ancylobacter lacus]|uniref:5-oxoprolinase subunit PxpB n=1 Tax=Ancylobacter lacus TaxID=2579970 RepID=UPI001BCD86D7|nr:5-oxoprolinase subunit PxpB [Ancylobacter lacus]MBS7538942.1 5-oxoprolinase subunit PxpB [Ancylobacter lacus]
MEVPLTARLADLARFLPVGDTAFAIEFGARIDPELNARVHRVAALIAAAPPAGVTETVPTFRSLLVHYDPRRGSAAAIQQALATLDLGEETAAGPARVWVLPTLYGGSAGPDLADTAAALGLPPEEVVARHAAGTYRVYMQGFLPGFAYLGDLDPRLDLPRLATPRVRVPPGSVAIAQRMTGVYPLESPGGWRLIGNTPVRFFDAARTPPTLFSPGDGVRFAPVGPEEHAAIRAAVAAGAFEPPREKATAP